MTRQETNNELGDELELNLMRKALPQILPNNFIEKHYPRNNNDALKPFVDYMIKEWNGYRHVDKIAIECKNWSVTPHEYQFKNWFLRRFENCPSFTFKIILGHVPFTEDQLEILLKKGIVYLDIGYQISPNDDSETKEEYLELLKTAIAFLILRQTGKYNKENISAFTLKVLSSKEILVKKDDERDRSFNLNPKTQENISIDFSKSRLFVKKIGKNPLDVIFWEKKENSLNQKVMYIPKDYPVYSDYLQIEEIYPSAMSQKNKFMEKLDSDLEFINESILDSTLKQKIKFLKCGIKMLDKFDATAYACLHKFGIDYYRRGLENFFKIVIWKESFT